MFKSLPLLLSTLCVPCSAGFITIDEFTDPTQSDSLGLRTDTGVPTAESSYGGVYYRDGYADLVGGLPEDQIPIKIFYDFLPSPLVASSVIRVRAKNNQTTFEETGVLSLVLNQEFRLWETLTSSTEYQDYDFDFTSQFTGPVSHLELEWTRPVSATGARQLFIDSVSIQETPEPPAIALLVTTLLVFGMYRLRHLFGPPPKVRLSSRNKK